MRARLTFLFVFVFLLGISGRTTIAQQQIQQQQQQIEEPDAIRQAVADPAQQQQQIQQQQIQQNAVPNQNNAASPRPKPKSKPNPKPAQKSKPRGTSAPSPIPQPLHAWKEWVRWNDPLADSPPVFHNAEKRIALWPSQLVINAQADKADFSVTVRVFSDSWLPLPGGGDEWPHQVRASDEKPLVVVTRDGSPAVRLKPGTHTITGEIPWKTMPQRLSIPPEIGVLELTMNGNKVPVPNWDENGFLWLKRNRAEAEEEREFLEAKIYRVLEDGIPMWLHTEIELSAAGKSREEDLGFALPEGWQVASVESKLPTAVENSGRLRVQVRAGKWSILLTAFRTTSASSIGFSESAPPIVEQEIIGFQAKPEFRLVELNNIPAIDVSQTTFPEKWRKFPVYRWDTAQPFQLEEKMRGMGFQKPSGLTVKREFWLDDDGALMTFRDQVTGQAQQVWRLDASPGQTLGAARLEGEGQLITKNPASGASGIEVRQRGINIEAVGRISDARNFPASGWQADVDQCDATLHLPPGWRLLAMTGAEWVRGDWLTSWTLLDLFLLLIFTMAVGKLWGWIPAIFAMIGFGLTYHEPGAPKYLWFVLLVPVAILRAGLDGVPKVLANIAKYLAIAALLVVLVPFIGKQLQGVLYPQLEPGGPGSYSGRGLRDYAAKAAYEVASMPSSSARKKASMTKQKIMWQKEANLMQDVQARIQTGPAVPKWEWRRVTFGWKGPVTESEQVKLILIPPGVQRCITILRVVMLILLVAVLLGVNRLLPRFLRSKKAPACIAGLLFLPFLQTPTMAQEFPSQALLDELEKRVLETPDAFPHAAEIPDVSLKVEKDSLKMTAEIHAAAQTAVPLPGKLPAWSPVSVSVDGQPAEAVARHDGFLWIVLKPGVHQVEVAGMLPGATEWAWSSLLKPRRVAIDAPGWTVTGIDANGVPENQVIFVLKSPATNTEVSYDRKDFAPAVLLERKIELGLVWQVRSTLKRLRSGGKAIALSVPLLEGERVLASNFTAKDGAIEVRLGASEKEITWSSELPRSEQVILRSPEAGTWVEQWRLIASPVWNVAFDGLAPVYESGAAGLEPVWSPWPGEQATLALSRPEAIPGETITVRGVEHTTKIGSRQRVSQLRMNLQASLGQELALELDPAADVTRLKIGDENNPDGKQQPVRRDEAKVIIPVRPGEQSIDLEWKMSRPVATKETVDRLELPVESSNINTSLTLPGDRWVLWTFGPLRGPAVRWWSVVLLSLIGAFVLGRLAKSPLRGAEWGLLILGLTQVHPIAIMVVIVWFFLLAWRGSDRAVESRPIWFNLTQLAIMILAVPVVGIVLFALHRGLLGTPEMMVQGNGSRSTSLRWFAQRTDSVLPEAGVISVSIWYYRFLMLAWAMWLALSALRWVKWGWQQFTRKGFWKSSPKKIVSPPELPEEKKG